MELKDAILNRRTVRQFTSRVVEEDVLFGILEAGIWAPSHGNNQPWEFVIIGPETRKKLAEMFSAYMEAGPLKNPALPEERKVAMRGFAKNFGDAPVLVAVTALPAGTDLDKFDFPMSTAAAIQNILLAAWEKEIAGVWLSFGMNQMAQALLQIPEGGRISGILALGYPDFIPPAQPRVSVKEKVRRLA